jgi:hypothetical protein
MYMRSGILAAGKVLMSVFWLVTPCGLVARYRLFRENILPSSAGGKSVLKSR